MTGKARGKEEEEEVVFLFVPFVFSRGAYVGSLVSTE